jgi:hypothetical protein
VRPGGVLVIKEPSRQLVGTYDDRGPGPVLEAHRPHCPTRDDSGNRLQSSLAARHHIQKDSSPMLGDTGEPFGSRGGRGETGAQLQHSFYGAPSNSWKITVRL